MNSGIFKDRRYVSLKTTAEMAGIKLDLGESKIEPLIKLASKNT
jgi:hypothetical protein